jgi:long-chain acyl-CoA synthetase
MHHRAFCDQGCATSGTVTACAMACHVCADVAADGQLLAANGYERTLASAAGGQLVPSAAPPSPWHSIVENPQARSAETPHSGQAASLQDMARAAFARDPSLPIIEFEKRWYTWGELRHVAERVSAAIAASDADPRASIAFAPRNCPSALAALLGLIADGRTIKMIFAFQSAAGIARDLVRLKPSIFIAAPRDLSREVLDTARTEGIAVLALSDMDVAAPPGLASTRRPSDPEAPAQPQIQILTSGTTGAPKQFPISYDLIASYLTTGTVLYASHGAEVSKLPPLLLFFPIANITGIYSTVPTLILGLRIVLLERFTLEGWRDHIRRFQPAQTGLPAAAIQMVLDADIPPRELACIKSCGTGAAPVDPAIQRAFEQRYGIPLLLSYGATEFGGRVVAMTSQLYAEWGPKKLGSVGRPVPGAKVRVVDAETGAALPAGREGILEVVSPRMGPDWIRTTDVALIDEDGFVFHRARADGAIMRGGFKILPETIERALLLHAAVAAAAVVGVADRRLGQTPAAAIQLKLGAEQPMVRELEAHLRQHVLATHIPTHWRCVEKLPQTPSMKVDRLAVRALFEPSQATERAPS